MRTSFTIDIRLMHLICQREHLLLPKIGLLSSIFLLVHIFHTNCTNLWSHQTTELTCSIIGLMVVRCWPEPNVHRFNLLAPCQLMLVYLSMLFSLAGKCYGGHKFVLLNQSMKLLPTAIEWVLFQSAITRFNKVGLSEYVIYYGRACSASNFSNKRHA